MVVATPFDQAGVQSQAWRALPIGYATRLSRGFYRTAPHLELLSQKFVETVYGVNKRRLIVTMPPRYGKSEHSSHYGPTWFMDTFPEKNFALTTYGAEFSQEWGRTVRDTIDAHADDLRVRIRKEARSRSLWRTTSGGGMYAVGIEGGLTGRGAYGLGIDDPHKNWKEANSIVYREAVWNFWLSVGLTRLEPTGFVIVTMTRWHEDDLVGRLIADQGTIEEGGRWEVLNLPCLAVEDDVLGRRPGETLWPWRFSQDQMEERKEEAGPYVWEALYQGAPTTPEGTILKRAWWRYYESFPTGLDLDATYQSWDMSFKDSDGTDFVCGGVWGIKGARRYLLDIVHDRMDFPTTVEAVRQFKAKWPRTGSIFIEDSANGPAVISTLEGEIPGIIAVPARGSKESRVHACAPFVKAGNVFLPSSKLLTSGAITSGLALSHEFDPDEVDEGRRGVMRAKFGGEAARLDWVGDFVAECAAFPRGPNDDRVDMFTMAMIETGLGGGSVSMGGYAPGSRGAGRR